MSKTVLVTVGTTKFDELIHAVIQPDALTALKQQGYTDVLLQTGNTDVEIAEAVLQDILPISSYRYKPSLSSDVASASLVISHAGAGTCLEVQAAKKPHIVVVNETLMNNHQTELAEKLCSGGHLVHCVPSTLVQTLKEFPAKKLTPLPPGNPAAFAAHLDTVVEDIYEGKKD